MNDWFTVENVDSDTYIISEYGHKEETHAYLICGAERAALIDTGLGIGNISEVARPLTNLPVSVLTTHVHWAHIGGHGAFSDIAVHEAEKDWLFGAFPLPISAVKKNLMGGMIRMPCGFSPSEYRLYQAGASCILHDGDVIDLGGRRITVIHTPGHSPGHCCFYESERKYLYSGDLIYAGRLDAFYPTTDPVAFYASVQRLSTFPVSRIFPAHHSLDIRADLAARVANAFEELYRQGDLKHGAGLFDFGAFSVRL